MLIEVIKRIHQQRDGVPPPFMPLYALQSDPCLRTLSCSCAYGVPCGTPSRLDHLAPPVHLFAADHAGIGTTAACPLYCRFELDL